MAAPKVVSGFYGAEWLTTRRFARLSLVLLYHRYGLILGITCFCLAISVSFMDFNFVDVILGFVANMS